MALCGRREAGAFGGACAEQCLRSARRAPACRAQLRLGSFPNAFGRVGPRPKCSSGLAPGSPRLTGPHQLPRVQVYVRAQRQEVLLLCRLRGRAPAHGVPSVPGLPAAVAACPRAAVRPRAACTPDGLAPRYLLFSRQSFVLLLLLFLISSGPLHLPTSQLHTMFLTVLFASFSQVPVKILAQARGSR